VQQTFSFEESWVVENSNKPNLGFSFCSLFVLQTLHDYLRLNFKRLSPLNYLFCFNNNAGKCGLLRQLILFLYCLTKPNPTKPKFGISKPLSRPQNLILNGFEMPNFTRTRLTHTQSECANDNDWRVVA
jgi:hypothetical protein